MTARPRSLLMSSLLGLALGSFGLASAPVIEPGAQRPRATVTQKQRRDKGKSKRARKWWARAALHYPHQGKRECARRRGDWETVSLINSAKRFPYGINHRLKHPFNDAERVMVQKGRRSGLTTAAEKYSRP